MMGGVAKRLAHNGETAYVVLNYPGAGHHCDAAILLAMPQLLSHAPGLEASTTGRTSAPRLALADPTAPCCLAGHDLEHRRLAARTL